MLRPGHKLHTFMTQGDFPRPLDWLCNISSDLVESLELNGQERKWVFSVLFVLSFDITFHFQGSCRYWVRTWTRWAELPGWHSLCFPAFPSGISHIRNWHTMGWREIDPWLGQVEMETNIFWGLLGIILETRCSCFVKGWTKRWINL